MVVIAICTAAAAREVLGPPARGPHHAETFAAAALLSLLALGLSWSIARSPSLSSRLRSGWMLFAGFWALQTLVRTIAVQATWLSGVELRALTFLVAALPLMTSPLAFVALLRLPPRPGSARDVAASTLDVGIVVFSAWIVMWHLLVGPALAQGFLTAVENRLAVAGLVGDLLVLAGAAYVCFRSPRGGRRTTLLLIATSAAAMVVADILRAGAAWGITAHVLGDLALLAPPVLFIAAAVEKRRRLVVGRIDPDDDLVIRPVAKLPFVGVTAVYVTVAWAAATAPGDVLALVVFAGALPILGLARRLVVARENRQLAREHAVMSVDSRFRAIVEHASDTVIVVDAGWLITFVSPSVERLVGSRPSQLIGRPMLDLVHTDDHADATNRLRECAADASRSMFARWRLRRSDQTFVEVDTVAVNLLTDKDVQGLVLTARDGSERRSLEAQLTHQAFHDPLTGLANRALFEDRVQHALARRRGGDIDALGAVFIDVDHFKSVNDTLGHAGGDALIKAAAGRLLSSLRAFDTAARIGGDEFAVLVDDIHARGNVVQVAERVTRAFAEPFVIDGNEVTCTASVGVAVASEGQSSGELLRNADLAMYLAKSRGRGQYAVFEPSMHAAAVTRQDLQRDLRHALDRGELSLVYQPIHALETRALVGAEALLRWVHPTRGPIPPSTFVPLAEDAGLMVPIGRWVIERACRDATGWRRGKRGRSLRVSVNLSSKQIPDESLFDDVVEAVKTTGLEPGSLVLELTEPMLVQHHECALQLLQRLKTFGVRVAIDDFGTGYSSLSYLQRLSIDILKIDRTFVDAVTRDEHAAQLTRAIVSLSESMSLVTIAEGIENTAQAERLRALGCDLGQGYLYGMPMSAEALGEYSERNRARLVG